MRDYFQCDKKWAFTPVWLEMSENKLILLVRTTLQYPSQSSAEKLQENAVGPSFWWILSFFKLIFQSVSSKLVEKFKGTILKKRRGFGPSGRPPPPLDARLFCPFKLSKDVLPLPPTPLPPLSIYCWKQTFSYVRLCSLSVKCIRKHDVVWRLPTEQ